MSNIDDVKNLYEGIAAEAYKMPDRVDPADIRKAQRAKKVRNLATDGATEGERAAAEERLKVLRCLVKVSTPTLRLM